MGMHKRGHGRVGMYVLCTTCIVHKCRHDPLYVTETTAKICCKHGKYRSFEHLLFLSVRITLACLSAVSCSALGNTSSIAVH